MNTKKIIILTISILVVFFLLFLVKERTPEGANPPEKMSVSASFYPLAFLAEQIGGDKVSVFNATPAGAEPHDYEPSPSDIAKISKSKVILLNGRGLEAWGDNIQKNTDQSKTIIVVAGDDIGTQNISREEDLKTDPHIWLDPLLTKQIAKKIEQAFIKADSKNASLYSQNLVLLNTELDAIDKEYRGALSNCAKKDIITSHAAFGYLAAEYNLNQVPIAGLSPNAEPSPKQLTEIIQFAKDNKITHIFFESLASPKLSNMIAHEIGAKTLVLNPIGGLTPDDIASGKNYFTEMRNNLENLKTALECQN